MTRENMSSTTMPRTLSRPDNDHDRAGYREVASDIAAVKKDLSQLSTDAASMAKQGLDSTLQGAKKAADQVKGGYEAVCDYTARHPVPALLIATGIGAIAGRILIRRW
jgi:ElaB/YqjD/DUF883 family membrane-anchored ribosome-binding protein